jgi:hypothetical protein
MRPSTPARTAREAAGLTLARAGCHVANENVRASAGTLTAGDQTSCGVFTCARRAVETPSGQAALGAAWLTPSQQRRALSYCLIPSSRPT